MKKMRKERTVLIDNSAALILITGEDVMKDGRYRYRWTEFGNRHTIYADNLTDLREAEENIHYMKRRKSDIDPYHVIVNDLHIMWKELKLGVRETTMRNYERIYEAYIRDAIGKTKLIELKHSDIKRFYGRLLNSKRVSRNTVKGIHDVLHQILQFGVDEGFVSKNPSDSAGRELASAVKRQETRRRALSEREEAAFLKACEENEDKDKWLPLFTVFFNTGMRISEISGLTWNDIDFNQEVICVSHALVESGAKGKRREMHTSPKTAAGNRLIPMTNKVKKTLLDLQKYQKLEGITSREEIDGYGNFVFLTRECKPFGQQAVNRAIRRIVDHHNYEQELTGGVYIPHFTSHDIRHTFGTRLMEESTNLKFVQYVMGQKDVQTTIDRYVHMTKTIFDDGRDAMNGLEQSLFQPRKFTTRYH